MSRLYGRLLILYLLVFTALLLLIHAQPYDDHELRDLLMPEGCPVPCFMGIRPGVTRADEAVRLLKAQAWVAQVVTNNPQKPYQIWWRWNTAVSEFLRSAPLNPNFPVNGEVRANGGVVSSIMLQPKLRLGDVVLLRGLPRSAQLIYSGAILNPSRSVSALMLLEYEADGFWISGTAQCPYTSALWYIPVRLTITNDFDGRSLGTTRPIDRKTFLDSIRRISNLMCGL